MLYYFLFGSIYAVLWVLINEDYVKNSILIAEAELEETNINESFDSLDLIKVTLPTVLIVTVITFWPIRFYYDFLRR